MPFRPYLCHVPANAGASHRFYLQPVQMRLTLSSIAALAFSAVASTAAWATSASAPAETSSRDAARCEGAAVTCLDAVQVTATRRPESTLDVPAATTIVGSRQLREAAPQTVMDALHGAVGTFVQQTTPGQGVVIVRGLKGSEVLHLVDGFRLNNAIFRNAPNQYVALVDSQSLDRIEVVRGPSSALYGGDAMGGVVQMLTREPDFAGADWQFGGRLRGIHASADQSFLGRAEFAAGRDGVALSGGVTWQDVDDLRIGGGTRLRPSGFSARAADVKLRGDVADGHELMLSLQYLKQPRTPRFDALVPGFGQTVADNSLFYFEPQARRFAQLRWRISQPTALFDNAELQVGQQLIVDDRRTRATGSNDEDRERNRDLLQGLSGQFGKALGDRHYLSYGFEAYNDRVDSSRLRTNVVSGQQSHPTPRFPHGSSMRSQSLFVSDDWRIGERFDLLYGLRYSRYQIRTPASAAAPAVSLSPNDLTGSLGLSVDLGGDWRFVSNLGRGFRAPNIFDIGLFGRRPGNRFNIANPALTPESVVSLDAGFKVGGDRLSGELIAFRSHYRDKITSVLTGAVMPDGALVVQNRNVTEMDMSGVEAGVRYHVIEPVELHATATWTRGDERLAGNEVPADRIPPLFGKAGVVYRPTTALSVEAYSYYATRQDRLSPRDLVDPRVNPAGTAGWATLNARVGWKLGDKLELALRMENLADKRYREHGTGLDEPGRNIVLSGDVFF